jgi:hypothetical protein
MLYDVFTVRDSKAEAFLQPFFAPNTSVAVRMLRDILAWDDQHSFFVNAEDYALYHLGQYDDVAGIIQPNTQPLNITSLSEVKASVMSTESIDKISEEEDSNE